jgi:hypothetical protein
VRILQLGLRPREGLVNLPFSNPESADNATKDDKVSALQAQKAEIARRCVGCGFFRLFCGLTNGD